MKILVAGGGWAGCAAAYEASKRGADVQLLERTDMLLGTGLVGGIVRNNGRYTVTEEMIAMGGGELFELIDENCRHKNIAFPGHRHASLYDIGKMPGAVSRKLKAAGVEIIFQARITAAEMEAQKILAVQTQDGLRYEADVFIDATGTAGPMANCRKYGNGCAMCILRCPSFGGRVSLTGLTGITEIKGRKQDGSIGAMSGSCKLYKESLGQEITTKLNKKGVVVIPVPEHLRENHLEVKACQQYALHAFTQNIILLDTGHGKLMCPFYPLQKLNQIPGFENARYEDPYGGSVGNSMRYFAIAPASVTMQVRNRPNLFCAGEKAGLFVGHTEAVITGVLAGYNSVRYAMGRPLFMIPDETAVGNGISFVMKQMETEAGRGKKYTFSGSVLFEHMKQHGLYKTDKEIILKYVDHAGVKNIFHKFNDSKFTT